MLFVALVVVALFACSNGQDQHYDLDGESGYWIRILDDECQECQTPNEEIEIVEELPNEIPVEPQFEEIQQTTHEPTDPMPPQTTIHICQNLVEAFKELQTSHPEVKILKKELKRKLKKSLPQFLEDLKHQQGDWRRVVISLLDYIIYLAEDLKAECHAENEVITPVPEPEHPETHPEQVPDHPVTEPEYRPQPEPEYTPEHEPEYTPEHVQEVQEVYEEIESGPSIYPGFVGSLRGIPGEHYPNYTEVPITSFSCADKKYIPGFYADLETGCQVFHVCYEHRRESFLCPLGTIFNQPILACDYWYSSNCSQAPLYYDINARPEIQEEPKEEVVSTIGALITTVIEGEAPKLTPAQPEEVDLARIVKFLPVKVKVTEFKKPIAKTVVASKVLNKIVSVAPSFFVKSAVVQPKLKPLPLAKAAVVKAKFAAVPAAKIAVSVAKDTVKVAAGVPLAKTKIVKTAGFVKTAVPVKAKFVAKAAAVPVAATVKVAAKVAPVAKAKVVVATAKAAAVPVKVAAAGAFTAAKVVPVAKFAGAKAIPIGKFAASAGVVKPKIVAASVAGGIPLVKAKFATAAISPLTKKALALGYMKLLKAKKIAVVG